jgi:hypothetical protein
MYPLHRLTWPNRRWIVKTLSDNFIHTMKVDWAAGLMRGSVVVPPLLYHWLDDLTEEETMPTAERNEDLLPPLIEWCRALATVQAFAPEAIIAGGSLRDLNTGVVVKDLDIFIQYFDGLEDKLIEVYGKDNIRMLSQASEEDYDGIDGTVMGGVYEVKSEHCDIPVQIISLVKFVSAQKQLDRFDIGLCMLAHDGIRYKGETKKFFTDLHDKTMTIYVDGEDEWGWVNKGLKHAQRLLLKYPEYQIQIEER